MHLEFIPEGHEFGSEKDLVALVKGGAMRLCLGLVCEQVLVVLEEVGGYGECEICIEA